MKFHGVLFVLLAGVTHAFAQTEQEQLNKLMQYYIAEQHFNGAVLIAYKGKILVDSAYGYRDVFTKTRHEKGDYYRIGSISKSFAAEVIMQLVQNGKLKVTDKVSKFFPAFPWGDKVTIHHLLTHTSGIYDYTADSLYRATRILGNADKDEILRLVQSHELAYTPGEKHEYSNSNYALLGMIAEQLTHKKYSRIVYEQVFRPAGMYHSGFNYDGLKDMHKSTGYGYLAGENEYMEAPTGDTLMADGAIYSTAADMYQWHKALSSYTLLKKDLQEKMYENYKGGYGYGWYTDTMYGNKKVVMHSGRVIGFTSYMLRCEQDDLCAILLQNNSTPNYEPKQMRLDIMACIYDKNFKVPVPMQVTKVSQQQMQELSGQYQLTPNFALHVFAEGEDMYVQGDGQERVKVVPNGIDVFKANIINAMIEFKKDAIGHYDRLVLHQGGRDMTAQKVKQK